MLGSSVHKCYESVAQGAGFNGQTSAKLRGSNLIVFHGPVQCLLHRLIMTM